MIALQTSAVGLAQLFAITPTEAWEIFAFSVRDGFVQVSAFVAVTVLLFSYVQYRTGGRIVTFLEANERLQPIAGALLGLTPGCGGAIVAMPLYIRGTISFGTVVATLAATAGDSAFVILALAPEAGLYAYGLAFVAAVLFGYAIDIWGLGVGRVDSAVARLGRPMTDGGFATTSVASGGPSVVGYESGQCGHDRETPTGSGAMTTLSHALHILWWVVAAAGLLAGVLYLARGAPEVSMELAPTFFGLFTVAGLTGTALSFYLHFVGRRYIGEGDAGRVREDFASAYGTFKHAAMETSMVTVWVLAAYLLYEYGMAIFALDIGTLAAAAGAFAPIAGALLGLVPGCAPQIVFATLYAEQQIPFSALTANAISQDGDALFPLMAIDMKAAIVATVYTTIPALITGILLHYFWPFASFGFGVL
ncbi:putative manganese transporter [Halomicroarcula limicola]|uniref:Putative manganese transporter n=1 Tax=Haloarcula limicola TaxID=1429915 RepID=A0A8J8C7X9_9EURY|nr:putative manganese transporter [Halomicroarcula limicola]MBV0925483.1 putative manganese transporter [Halomicroarcula limicola]